MTCTVCRGSPGRRPLVEAIREWYARDDVLNEILQAMQRWHVKFMPGYAPSSWLYTEDAGELRTAIERPLELMARHPERRDYPYFRIFGERHRPAPCWDEDTLVGYDFVIEKDGRIWQECFEAMLPVLDVLEHHGVYYWLKYTGHHSLHVILPAEVFPASIRGVSLAGRHRALHHRLMVFLNKRARQHYNDHDRHCLPGTNMPYSVNEDTGLVNYPLLREELAGFRPWRASTHLAQVRDLWRKVPPEARGSGEALLLEALRPYGEQRTEYPSTARRSASAPLPEPPPGSSVEQAVRDLGSGDVPTRRCAAWALMLLGDASLESLLCRALGDQDPDVRWFAAEALARVGTIDALPALLQMTPDDMASASFVDYCVGIGESIVPELVRALQRRPLRSWHALPVDKALERIGVASRPQLEALRAGGSTENRRKATAILARIAGQTSFGEALEASWDPRRYRQAVKTLAWYDDPRAGERLVELAGEGGARVRKDAVKYLDWTDSPERAAVFQSALDDPQPKIRRWAERGLEHAEQLEPLLSRCSG